MKFYRAGSIATCLSQFIDKNLTWSVHTLKTLKDCGGQNRNSSKYTCRCAFFLFMMVKQQFYPTILGTLKRWRKRKKQFTLSSKKETSKNQKSTELIISNEIFLDFYKGNQFCASKNILCWGKIHLAGDTRTQG